MIQEHIEQITAQLTALQSKLGLLPEDSPQAEATTNAISVFEAELAIYADAGYGRRTPEAQALQAKAQEQRQIAANMRAQATADEILKTLPTDPTPDDHDAVAEQLERAAQGERP